MYTCYTLMAHLHFVIRSFVRKQAMEPEVFSLKLSILKKKRSRGSNTLVCAHPVPFIICVLKLGEGSTGVIYCTDRAIANGFSYADSHSWANLGQGAPEVGPIPGAPEKPPTVSIPVDSLEYAPTTGVKGMTSAHGCNNVYHLTSHYAALREAVAKYYNETYRADKASKYTHENVRMRTALSFRLLFITTPRSASFPVEEQDYLVLQR